MFNTVHPYVVCVVIRTTVSGIDYSGALFNTCSVHVDLRGYCSVEDSFIMTMRVGQ